jgi:hypothetical protein
MKLNPEFMAKYGNADNNTVTMVYGHKIEDLTREELLAVVRSLIEHDMQGSYLKPL